MAAMINIIGPSEGKYVVAFTMADGRSIGLVVPQAHADVLSEVQEMIPYGLAVPEVDDFPIPEGCGEDKTRAKS